MPGENSAEDTFLAFVGPELLKITLVYLPFSNERVQRKPSSHSDTNEVVHSVQTTSSWAEFANNLKIPVLRKKSPKRTSTGKF